MPNDYELYVSVAEEVPYVKYFVKAAKIIEQMYNFGRESQEERALRLLQEQVDVLRADIADLNQRVDVLNGRVAQGENLARLRQLSEHHIQIESLARRLGRTPGVDDLADIAGSAGLRIDALLNDTDLWLWSDIGVRRTPGGDEVTELVEPHFTVIPIPVLTAATSVFCLATAMHVRREPTARALYTEASARFLRAVSLRPEFRDGWVDPATLPEKIRSRISVVIGEVTRYVTNGRCIFSLVAVNRIERTTTVLPDIVIPARSDAPANTFCQAPSTLGGFEEAEAEDAYPPLQILATLEEMLDRITRTGSLADPFVGRFPEFTLHRLDLYAVEPDGRLIRFRCDIRTDLAGPVVRWQSDRTQIGTGWHGFSSVLPGDWNVLYALGEDNSVLWYRHDGAPNNASVWSGPRTAVTAHRTLGIDSVVPIAGSHGTIYRAVRSIGGAGQSGEVRIRSELTVDRHADHRNGTGEFAGQVTIDSSWPRYVTQFGGTGGVVYGIDGEGRLFWHRHETGRDGGTVHGPHQVGHGWNSFVHVFSAGPGFLFGVYPNGTMVAYHLRYSGPGPTGDDSPRWSGPASVEGSGWNAFVHLVPILDQAPTRVG